MWMLAFPALHLWLFIKSVKSVKRKSGVACCHPTLKLLFIPSVSPSYRNLLYSLPGKTPQFSALRFPQEDAGPAEATQRSAAVGQEASSQHAAYDNQSLSLILAAVRSAEMLVCFGLGLFDDNNAGEWRRITAQASALHSTSFSKNNNETRKQLRRIVRIAPRCCV